MIAVLLAMLCLLSGFAHAAPEIVGFASTSKALGAGTNGGTVFTLQNFEAPPHVGTSHVLVAVCTEGAGSFGPTMVSWGGIAGAQIRTVDEPSSTATPNRAALWWVPNVAPSTASVSVTLSGDTAAVLVAAVLHDVDPPEASGVGHNLGTSVLSTVQTQSSEALLVDMACYSAGGAITPGAGQALGFTLAIEGQRIGVSSKTGPITPGSTTLSWAGSSGRYAQVAAAFPMLPPTCAGCDFIPQDTEMIALDDNPYPACQGIVPDGVTDVSAAVSACASYWGPTGIYQPGSTEQVETFYFRNRGTGIYQFSGQVRASTEEDRISYLCDPGVVLRLTDNTPGFTDQCTPKGLFYAGNPGAAAAAFQNNFERCEIDLGNNPGADGLDHVVNNVGAVRGNFIHGTAFNRGISLTRKVNGPMIVDHNRIEGGRVGIDIAQRLMSAVLNRNVTAGQTVAGVRVQENVVTILNHQSVQTNGRPAVEVATSFWMPFLDILGGTFENSDTPGTGAIMIDNPGVGTPARVLARDISAPGYAYALKRDADSIPGPISEWVSHPILTLFPSAPVQTLHLPFPEHPHRVHPSGSDWVNLCAPPRPPCDGAHDNTAALAALVAPGGPRVVYFTGRPTFAQLDIPAGSNLERLVGFDATIYPAAGATSPWITSHSDRGVELERFWVKSSAPAVPRLRQASTGALILTDVNLGGTMDCLPGSGPMFLENVAMGQLLTCGNDLIFRQLNIEATAGIMTPKLTCNGGSCVGAGFKTENRGQSQVQAACISGAQCEIFGGFHLGASDLASSTQPLYRCENSSCFVSYATTVDNPINPIQMRAERDGVVLDLGKAATADRGQGEAARFLERP